jgi:acetate kinase
MKILVLNSGSSSSKFALYDIQKVEISKPEPPIWSITYELDANQKQSTIDLRTAIKEQLATMPIPLSEIDAVGHRIVHGGSEFQNPTLITPNVKQAIKELFPLAPLHNPSNLEGIEIIEELLPNIPQVAVFDTEFHKTLSEAASTYPGPYSWKNFGIKRYGFHGISYKYCAARCALLLNKDPKKLKIVCCHLGNGASIAAIDGSRSIDTTMGFTPIEGLMMGTRSGSIDPAILLFLQKYHHQSPEELFHALNFSSGLQGISGNSSDMRKIIDLRMQGDSRAMLAFDMYIHSLKRNIGAMTAVLGGLDALVFTAGIGENAAAVRLEACKELKHLGISLDQKRNQTCHPDSVISADDSQVGVVVITTEEDWCIACTIKNELLLK